MLRCVLVLGGLVPVAIASTLAAQAQRIKQSEVPKVVVGGVLATYPLASITQFARNAEGGKVIYEVQLEGADGTHWQALVTPEGKVVVEQRAMELKDAPESVRKSLASSGYQDAAVTSVERVTKPDRPDDAPTFEIVVHKGNEKRRLVFEHTGELKKGEKAGKKD
jgi:hypothetical protein